MKLSDSLQKACEREGARIRVGYPWWLRHLLARDVVAITLSRWIFVLPAFLLRPPEQIERLVRHELQHVRQVNKYGVLGFYGRYLLQFAKHFVRERSINGAYKRISFEIEACEAEQREEEHSHL